MVPHGDAGDAAQSRRVVDEVAVAVARDDVVREFVLHDDLDELVAKGQHVLERLDRHDPMLLPSLACVTESLPVAGPITLDS